MTFLPGNSANPKGGSQAKTKLIRQVKELLAKDVHLAHKVIQRSLRNTKDARLALEAAKLVLEYVYGKPSQQVDLNVDPEALGVFLNGIKFGAAIDVTENNKEDPKSLPAPEDPADDVHD